MQASSLPRRRPPHRTRLPPKPTAERILDAAEARFAAKGYDATSLGDIADDVRIRAPSLYKHFGSKRELYDAVLRRLLDPYFELLVRLLAVPRDAAEAESNLVAVVTHYVKHPSLAKLVQHAALAEGEELDRLVRQWYAPLFERAVDLSKNAPYVRRGARASQAISLVVAFHSLMSGYVTMAPLHARITGEDPHGERAIARYIDLMRAVAASLWR
jgi:TetR/AcrR family transcriptional regulator